MRLRKLVALPAPDRHRLAQAFFLLLAIGVALRAVPFHRLWRLLDARPRGENHAAATDGVGARRVAWAIAVASRYMPGAGRCLPQALAAHALLRWEGLPSRVWLGFARRVDGNVEGHAWVESEGRPVVGGGDVDRYCSIALESTRETTRTE